MRSMCFDLSDGTPCEFEALINAEIAKRIAGIKADHTAQCDFGIRHVTSEDGTDTSYFAWVIDQSEGFCPLVDTEYPDWKVAVSGNYQGSLEVSADALSKAVDLLRPILRAQDSRDTVKLSGNGTLYVSASAESEGSGRITLETQHASGPDILIGLNYKRLQTILKAYKKRAVIIRYGNELSPIAVCGSNADDRSAILMPGRLPD